MKTKKIILWALVGIVVFGLVFYSLGYRITKMGGSGQDTSLSSIPEKCRPPIGEDLNSWKEHLGHHAETKECLQYFS